VCSHFLVGKPHINSVVVEEEDAVAAPVLDDWLDQSRRQPRISPGVNKEKRRNQSQFCQFLCKVGFPSLNFQIDFEFAVEVNLPIVGILLELVNSRFARWVNVGCFAVAGCFWLAAAVWSHSDPFFGVLLIIALGLLTIAGITELVYRGTRNIPFDVE
jgi:hypothetical protein